MKEYANSISRYESRGAGLKKGVRSIGDKIAGGGAELQRWQGNNLD